MMEAFRALPQRAPRSGIDLRQLILAAVILAPAQPARAAPLDLSLFHLTFDWEGNNFNSAPASSGMWRTALAHGLRTISSSGEQEYYVDSSIGINPFSLRSNGTLRTTAMPQANPGGLPYTSGVFTTQLMYSQTYGYFEMRAKLASGAGMWPAFYLVPVSGQWPPELDVLEAFGALNPANGQGGPNSFHWDIHSNSLPGGSTGGWVSVNQNIYTGFHAYGVDWEPNFVTWYFDGQPVMQAPTPPDLCVPMYAIIDLAVGGSWAGNPAGETGQMDVDYVRIFSRDPTVPAVRMQTISSPDGGGFNLYGAQTLP